MSKLEFRVFQDIEFEGCWRVEALNEETKEIQIALFSGPDCERLAHEYEAFRAGKHPAAKSIPAPTAAPTITSTRKDPDTVIFDMADGEQRLVRYKELVWRYGKQRNRLVGEPKPITERIGTVVKGKA